MGIGVIPHRHKDFLCWVSVRPLNLWKHHPDRVSLSVCAEHRPSSVGGEYFPPVKLSLIFCKPKVRSGEGQRGESRWLAAVRCLNFWALGGSFWDILVQEDSFVYVGIRLYLLFLKSLHPLSSWGVCRFLHSYFCFMVVGLVGTDYPCT